MLAGFAKRVKKRHRALEKAGGGNRISQESLGERVGRSGGSVSEWERAEAMPDFFTVIALAREFGVEPGWLAFGKGPKYIEEDGGQPRPPDGPTSTIAGARVSQDLQNAVGGLPEKRT